ncbi:unnamed protein product, partial [Prunus brigantina]
WDLLLVHLPRSSASSTRTTRMLLRMQEVRDILLKSLPELPKTRDLPYKKVAEKQGLATEVSKHEIVANAYKLGYLDCKNGAPPCCPLEHEDGEQLYLDLLKVSRSML